MPLLLEIREGAARLIGLNQTNRVLQNVAEKKKTGTEGSYLLFHSGSQRTPSRP